MKNKKIFADIKAAAVDIVCDSLRFPVKPLSNNVLYIRIKIPLAAFLFLL